MQAIRSLTLVAALAAGAATAHAHAYLDHTSPRVGSTVTSSPGEVRMWFTQALEPKFTTAQLRSSAGAVIANGGVDGADPKQIVIRVQALPPGSYKVFWKVLSVDAHHTEGSFGFQVKP
jgi:copper resistance protein C